MRFIMRTIGDRDLSEYKKAIPPLIFAKDFSHSSLDTFKLALFYAEDDASVHLEDDIILCNNFYDKIRAEIAKRPNDVIQFFSMRGDDIKIGSRYINGSQYLMNQCFYLPKGMAKDVLEFSKTWDPKDPDSDTMLRGYFAKNKIKYWNVCPNLVDHKQEKSRINPRRSTKRQSFTFRYD